MKSIRTRRRSKDNRAVDRVVYRAVHQAVIDAVNVAAWWAKAMNLGVIGVVAEVVWRAVDEAGGRTATRNVRRVVVDAAPRANHPALQDFLKGVKLQ